MVRYKHYIEPDSCLNADRLISTFEKRPCPLPKCYGYGDPYDGVPNCSGCGGSGHFWYSEHRTTGELLANVHRALLLQRAFDEGYSAGLTDCNA